MEQNSLFMQVARTLISWKSSHTLLVQNSGGSHQEALVDSLGPRCYGLPQREYVTLSRPLQKDKDQDPQAPCACCLVVWL